MEAERLRLSQEAAARDAERAARERASVEAGGGIEAAAEQRKAAGFLQRSMRAEQEFGRLNYSPRGGFEQMGVDLLPKPLANQYASDPTQRQAETLMKDFIAATLRYESGAAVPDQEMATQREFLFPAPGDDQATIELKARRRQAAIDSLKLGAGPAASLVTMPELAPSQPQMTPEQVNAKVGEMLIAGRSKDEIVSFLKSTGRTLNPDEEAAIAANVGNPNPDVRQGEVNDNWRKFLVGTGDVVQAIGNIPGLIANPLNAGLNALGVPQALGMGELGTDLGGSLRDTLGFPRPINETEQLISAVNQGAAGGLGFAGAARLGGQFATGVTRNALAQFAAAPAADVVAGGAGGGSGEFARQQGAGPVGQLAATLAGGAAALPAAMRANALLAGRPQAINPLVEAGRQEGVTVNRAMADPNVQNTVTGVETTRLGGPIVQRGMGQVRDQIQAGVQRLGQGGDVLDTAVAGGTVRGSAERYIKQSGREAKVRYDRAEKAAGDVRLSAPSANAVLDDTIARLSETANTNSKEIAYLQTLKADLSKPISVGALRDLRTTLRKQIARGELVFGQNEARVLSVMDALSQDIAQGLVQQGKGNAAKLFQQADNEYRARMEFIQGTVQKIIGRRDGNLSPEQVFSRLRAMATPKGDSAGLARIIRTMEPEERSDIAATFADELGKGRDGSFSTAALVSNAERLPAAARVNLFGQDGAASLDRLVKLAAEHKRVMGNLNNSRTAVGNDYRSWLSNIIFGGGGSAGVAALATDGGNMTLPALAGAAGAAGMKATRDILTARSMMNTDLSKWLASAPKTQNPNAINAHFNRLGQIASRNPALAAEIEQLQQAVMRAAQDNARTMGSAAASPDQRPEEQKRR